MFLLFALLALSSLKKILFWVGLWQTKEYRRDRLWVHFRETKQGRSLFTSSSTIWGTLITLSYVLVIFYDWFTPYFQLLVVSFFLFYIFDFGKQILDRKVKRPIFTYKAVVIIVASFALVSILYFFPLTDKYLWTLLLLGFTPFVVATGVFIFSFPSEMYTDYLSQKAQNKLNKLKHLTVIAVSGSYGKSSTKEAIAHVLSQKFSVVKTPLSNNTPVGIAKTILNRIHDNTQFFIVEMGAYKIGEIAQICTIVKPDISVTTSISDQHISLYGNLDNVVKSEKELIDALPKNGLALFNANNKNTELLSAKTKQKKIFYTISQHKKRLKGNYIAAYDVTLSLGSVLFSTDFQNVSVNFRTPLLGEHVIENILPAIYLGIKFGLSEKDLQKGVATLTPLPQTMQKISLPNGVVGIDDSFNASPESVIASAKFLKSFSKKKFFVLTPLIELGKNGHARHGQIGEFLSDLDYLFVTNKNYYEDLERGILAKKGKAILIVGSYQEITDALKRFAKKGDCIIFEGKEAGVVLKKML